jgi:hypothetical protein
MVFSADSAPLRDKSSGPPSPSPRAVGAERQAQRAVIPQPRPTAWVCIQTESCGLKGRDTCLPSLTAIIPIPPDISLGVEFRLHHSG